MKKNNISILNRLFLFFNEMFPLNIKKKNMEDPPPCRRCGKCCFVDLTAYAQKEDYDRWRAENRQDILSIIEHRHLIWVGDRMISTETGDYPRECLFLYNNGAQWLCSIYETRPLVCCEYQPGSSELCPQWKINRNLSKDIG
jgi:Fe-S-cluster containining protein